MASAKGSSSEGVRHRMVQLARVFKRSWVEMAEALVQLRSSQLYLEWGYQDLYSYCALELQLRKATVDKLTGSYVALEKHAPNVLSRDGVAQPIPTCDAVDYFARALRGDPANDGGRAEVEVGPSEEVIEELRHAVFEEHTPVAALRRRFNPVLHPKPEGSEALETLQKAQRASQRLAQLLPEIEGLPKSHAKALEEALTTLDADLEKLLARAETDASHRRAG